MMEGISILGSTSWLKGISVLGDSSWFEGMSVHGGSSWLGGMLIMVSCSVLEGMLVQGGRSSFEDMSVLGGSSWLEGMSTVCDSSWFKGMSILGSISILEGKFLLALSPSNLLLDRCLFLDSDTLLIVSSKIFLKCIFAYFSMFVSLQTYYHCISPRFEAINYNCMLRKLNTLENYVCIVIFWRRIFITKNQRQKWC